MGRRAWAWVVLAGCVAAGAAGCGRDGETPAASTMTPSAAAEAALWSREGARLTAEFEAALKAEDYQRAYGVLAPVRSAMPAELRGRHRFAERELQRIGQIKAAEAAEQKRAAEVREALAQAVLLERDSRIGPKPVASPWDGAYYEVERYLKRVLHDPDSLDFDGCTLPVQVDQGWRVTCDYRARNGFGALRRESGVFVIRHNEVVAKLD